MYVNWINDSKNTVTIELSVNTVLDQSTSLTGDKTCLSLSICFLPLLKTNKQERQMNQSLNLISYQQKTQLKLELIPERIFNFKKHYEKKRAESLQIKIKLRIRQISRKY
jgi:hypothetical protein